MAGKPSLDATLEGLRSQLEQLEAEADALRRTIELLENRRNVDGRMVHANHAPSARQARGKTPRELRRRTSSRPARRRPPRQGSVAALTVQLIRDHGGPMKVDEIVVGLEQLGKTANPDSVGRILRREAAEATVLVETAAGEIGLAETFDLYRTDRRQLSLQPD